MFLFPLVVGAYECVRVLFEWPLDAEHPRKEGIMVLSPDIKLCVLSLLFAMLCRRQRQCYGVDCK